MTLPLEPPASEARHGEEVPLSVSELVSVLADTLQSQFADVMVVGELTSFKRAPSGHCYFSLADDDACMDAVMWKNAAMRLAFEPRAGDEVVCRGSVGIYPKQGRMQLYVSAMRPVGAGAAQRALELLKKKLAAEGLFDDARKRTLPFFPRTIGVVTSRSGAAIHDILTTIRRRCRHCRVVLSPAVVQGPEASSELRAALEALARFGECDVVVIGRGGGATEDLSAFNEEALVRAVAAFPVPIVSAVGHEVDFTLCDFAADYRAATPTAAAEAIVPVYSEIADAIAALDARLQGSALRYVDNLRHRVGNLAGKLRDPATLVAAARQRSDELMIRMERALVQRHRRAGNALDSIHARLQRLGRSYVAEVSKRLLALESRVERASAARVGRARTELAELHSKLYALSPLAVLERGYSLATRADGVLVRSSADVAPGDGLNLRFHRGAASARVESTSDPEDRE